MYTKLEFNKMKNPEELSTRSEEFSMTCRDPELVNDVPMNQTEFI